MLSSAALTFLGSLAGSVLSATVAIASAVWLWRFQAAGKRRAEIAEDALVAFQEMLVQLHYCRLGSVGLPRTLESGSGIDPQWGEHGREYQLVLARLSEHAHLFASIRKYIILCDIFFGKRSASAFEGLEDYVIELRRRAVRGYAASVKLERLQRMFDQMSSPPEDIRESYERTHHDLNKASDFVFAPDDHCSLVALDEHSHRLAREMRAAMR